MLKKTLELLMLMVCPRPQGLVCRVSAVWKRISRSMGNRVAGRLSFMGIGQAKACPTLADGGGSRHSGRNFGEDFADIARDSRHDSAGGDRDESSQQGVFNEILTGFVPPKFSRAVEDAAGGWFFLCH